jgi:hypothetical protein
MAPDQVISQMTARHRAVEFRRFLIHVDKQVRRAGPVGNLRQLLHPQHPRPSGGTCNSPDLQLLTESWSSAGSPSRHQAAAPEGTPPLGVTRARTTQATTPPKLRL